MALHPLRRTEAAALIDLITANRSHLDRWLRWSAAIRTREEAEALISDFEAKAAAGDGFHCGIWVEAELAGGVVCWYIHRQSRNAEVGYWLGEKFVGTRRESHWITDRFVDHVIYGMLDREWAARISPALERSPSAE